MIPTTATSLCNAPDRGAAADRACDSCSGGYIYLRRRDQSWEIREKRSSIDWSGADCVVTGFSGGRGIGFKLSRRRERHPTYISAGIPNAQAVCITLWEKVSLLFQSCLQFPWAQASRTRLLRWVQPPIWINIDSMVTNSLANIHKALATGWNHQSMRRQ